MKKKYLLITSFSVLVLAGIVYAWAIGWSLTVLHPNDVAETTVPLSTGNHYRISLHGDSEGVFHTELIRNSDGWHLVDKYGMVGTNGFLIYVDDNFTDGNYTFRVTNLSTVDERILTI